MEYFRGVAMNRLIAIDDALALLPPSLPAEAQPLNGTIARLTIPTDPQLHPVRPCSKCGTSFWWRMSILSGGPGPWHCQQCGAPDVADWIDACAAPEART
jgi:hypothetical protein